MSEPRFGPGFSEEDMRDIQTERRRAPQSDALVEALAEALRDLYNHCADQGWLLKSHATKVMDMARSALSGSALAAPRPERTYNAEKAREEQIRAFMLGAEWNATQEGTVGRSQFYAEAEAEALLRYPSGERKDGEAGK